MLAQSVSTLKSAEEEHLTFLDIVGQVCGGRGGVVLVVDGVPVGGVATARRGGGGGGVGRSGGGGGRCRRSVGPMLLRLLAGRGDLGDDRVHLGRCPGQPAAALSAAAAAARGWRRRGPSPRRDTGHGGVRTTRGGGRPGFAPGVKGRGSQGNSSLRVHTERLCPVRVHSLSGADSLKTPVCPGRAVWPLEF